MSIGNKPAFPRPIGAVSDVTGITYNKHQTGMTYRQWLAGMAMQGKLASGAEYERQEHIGRDAVRYADAVIAEQERQSTACDLLLEACKAVQRDCREVLEDREPLSMDLIYDIANGRLKSAIAAVEGTDA